MQGLNRRFFGCVVEMTAYINLKGVLAKVRKQQEHLQEILTVGEENELEDVLKEAEQFTAEIQNLLQWLNEIDNALSMSKSVGGSPETASGQLELLIEINQELEKSLQLVESCHERGSR
ncbi:hypothetical protein DAPPUDRAFT_318984 [Daphnia pulex]|uniref:Uncharacterized protein n=1 Tax=Daphnia pulex TaxID=6669 RepID=E9GKC7_DAPPU|nr:hypothetical protein DAPPUDRAFT_318984 [Daphnia pulex]|eukprot:EFX79968.1 hypothetical protein DAPPUDRAFT_318984 [Daphnia pulex]